VVSELAALHDQELRLLERVEALRSVSRTSSLADDAVKTEYARVHRAYVELAERGAREALKRAVFLPWIEQAEPSFLTGVEDLDAGACEQTWTMLEQLCALGQLDSELMWMLPYYFGIAEWVFPSDRCPCVVDLCRPRASNPPSVHAAQTFAGRGQMGLYWGAYGR
jgi:hypothetical protein